MAIFLNPNTVANQLLQLISNSSEKLVLATPILKFNEKIKQVLSANCLQKIAIQILFSKNELNTNDYNWLKSMPSIRIRYCTHIKTAFYLNEKEVITTAMNLQDLNNETNTETGIYILKEINSELYKDVLQEIERLIKMSIEINIQQNPENTMKSKTNSSNIFDHIDKRSERYLSTTALAKELGISNKALFLKLAKLGFIKKDDFDEWVLTNSGERVGGQIKTGQYGVYITWTESIRNELQ